MSSGAANGWGKQDTSKSRLPAEVSTSWDRDHRAYTPGQVIQGVRMRLQQWMGRKRKKDMSCVLPACVRVIHTRRTRQYTREEEEDCRAYSPSSCPHFCDFSSCTSSHFTYTHHPDLSVSHLPAVPCPANGGRPQSWLTRMPCAEL